MRGSRLWFQIKTEKKAGRHSARLFLLARWLYAPTAIIRSHRPHKKVGF
jgi:hypothetical protein